MTRQFHSELSAPDKGSLQAPALGSSSDNCQGAETSQVAAIRCPCGQGQCHRALECSITRRRPPPAAGNMDGSHQHDPGGEENAEGIHTVLVCVKGQPNRIVKGAIGVVRLHGNARERSPTSEESNRGYQDGEGRSLGCGWAPGGHSCSVP